VQLVTFPGSVRLQLLCLRITITIDHPLPFNSPIHPIPLPFAALGRYKSEAGLKGLDDIECTSAYPTAHGEYDSICVLPDPLSVSHLYYQPPFVSISLYLSRSCSSSPLVSNSRIPLPRLAWCLVHLPHTPGFSSPTNPPPPAYLIRSSPQLPLHSQAEESLLFSLSYPCGTVSLFPAANKVSIF
jgi:hypothetical protein